MARDIVINIGAKNAASAVLKKVGGDLRRTASVSERLGQRMKASLAVISRGLVIGGAAAAGFATAVAVASVKAASNMEETMNKFNVVFGENSKMMKKWGDDFAGQMGRSKQQVADFLASSQDLFIPLGFDPVVAEGLSKQLTGLAIDLGSFNNKLDTDVLRDLHAALTGSGEVMKKYGVIVSEAAVKQEILNKGMDPKVATDQQKVFARLSIIMRGTTAAQGDAQRSAGSFANQMKALGGSLEDVKVAIGESLLPVFTPLIEAMVQASKTTADWLESMRDGFTQSAAESAVWSLLVKNAFVSIARTAITSMTTIEVTLKNFSRNASSAFAELELAAVETAARVVNAISTIPGSPAARVAASLEKRANELKATLLTNAIDVGRDFLGGDFEATIERRMASLTELVIAPAKDAGVAIGENIKDGIEEGIQNNLVRDYLEEIYAGAERNKKTLDAAAAIQTGTGPTPALQAKESRLLTRGPGQSIEQKSAAERKQQLASIDEQLKINNEFERQKASKQNTGTEFTLEAIA